MAVSFHNTEVLKSIRARKKQQPKTFFGITYTVNRCKGGKFGVYVKALSGEALISLSSSLRIPYMRIDAMPDNWSLLNGFPVYSLGAIPVYSGRIARKSTEQRATDYMKRLIAAPKEYQLQVCGRLKILPLSKSFKLVKLQYYRFSRMFRGEFLPAFTSQDAKGSEKLALNYAKNNIPAKLTPTIGRTIAIQLLPNSFNEHTGNEVKVTVKGLKGMTKDIKDQAPEFLRRIKQKRKRTTTVKYWKNKR